MTTPCPTCRPVADHWRAELDGEPRPWCPLHERRQFDAQERRLAQAETTAHLADLGIASRRRPRTDHPDVWS